MDPSESFSTNKFVPEYRRTNYKNKGKFSADELRRRRDTQQVELRKAKRDEVLAKRRNVVVQSTTNNDSDSDSVPSFIQLLYSPSIEVKEQVIWALGNVAGDSTSYRDYVLECGAMQPILSLFSLNKTSLIRTATWSLSNLCRGRKPQPDWNIVSQALPTLSRLIYSLDTETLIDACWSISYLSDGPTAAIQAVIENRIPKRLVELLLNQSTSVQIPALRAIGNIVTGNDLQTQTVINAGVLPALSQLLYSPKDNIKKESCWTISNITAGNTNQIEAVIAANLIPPLIKLLTESEYKTKKEACWAISNASAGGLEKPEIIKYLVEQGCIKPLCDLLDHADSKIKEVTLDALENILKVGEVEKEAKNMVVNAYAEYIDQAGGTDKIFMCQQDANQTIYEKSYGIIDKYFNDEDEDDIVDESMNNNISQQGNTFSFGANVGNQQFNFE